MTRAGNVWVCGCVGGVWVGVGVCMSVCVCVCVWSFCVYKRMQVHSYVFGNQPVMHQATVRVRVRVRAKLQTTSLGSVFCTSSSVRRHLSTLCGRHLSTL